MTDEPRQGVQPQTIELAEPITTAAGDPVTEVKLQPMLGYQFWNHESGAYTPHEQLELVSDLTGLTSSTVDNLSIADGRRLLQAVATQIRMIVPDTLRAQLQKEREENEDGLISVPSTPHVLKLLEPVDVTKDKLCDELIFGEMRTGALRKLDGSGNPGQIRDLAIALCHPLSGLEHKDLRRVFDRLNVADVARVYEVGVRFLAAGTESSTAN